MVLVISFRDTYLSMKNKIVLLLFTLTITSCFYSNFQSERVKSPSNKYIIYATVNRLDDSDDSYAEVVLHLCENDNKEIDRLNTGAGDFSKWALGWTESGDTIVLQSSDVGSQACDIQNNRLVSVRIDDKIKERAQVLKVAKYESDN